MLLIIMTPSQKKYLLDNDLFKEDEGYMELKTEVDMKFQKIINLPNPTSNHHPVTKQYFLDNDMFEKRNNKMTMKEDIDMNRERIINLAEPIDDDDAVSKKYLNSNITQMFQNRASDILVKKDINMNKKRILNLPSPNTDFEPLLKGNIANSTDFIYGNVGSDKYFMNNGYRLKIYSTSFFIKYLVLGKVFKKVTNEIIEIQYFFKPGDTDYRTRRFRFK